MPDTDLHPNAPGGPNIAVFDPDARSTNEPRQTRPLIDATAFVKPDLSALPPRPWVYGHLLMRNYVTVTVAPGGVGKSTLTASEALSLATGRELLGKTVPERCNVWIFNLEDGMDELTKCIGAAMEHHGVTNDYIAGRLFVDSGRIQQLILAMKGQHGASIEKAVRDRVIEIMLARKIDVLIIDPFVSSHRAEENDNNAIDMIAKEWGYIAEQTNAAIHIVHHVRKQSGDAQVTTESSRGAKALTDAARVVRTLNQMSEEEAKKAGVDNRRQYFRTYNDKANFAPPAADSDWYHLASYDIGNADDLRPSDSIGVVECWVWPVVESLSPEDALEIQNRVYKDGLWRSKPQAKTTWIGKLIGEVTGLSPSAEDEREEIKSIIRLMFDRHLLTTETRRTDNRKKAEFVVVDQWQSLKDETLT